MNTDLDIVLCHIHDCTESVRNQPIRCSCKETKYRGEFLMNKKLYFCMLLAVLTIVASIQPAMASESARPRSPEESLRRDAEAYAAIYGVELQEAIQRLRLQQVAADLNARLQVNEHGKFAGIYIEHVPQYRIVVLFTQDAENTLKPYIENGPLGNVAESKTTEITLAELEAAQENIGAQLSSLGVLFSSALDVPGNRINLVVTDLAAFDQILQQNNITLPSYFAVSEGNVDAIPQVNIYAGAPLDDGCTAGYVVYSTTYGTKYGTTAGHCNPNYVYPGTSNQTWYPFVWEWYGGNKDFELHSMFGTPQPWAV